jgi:hypothetical protein
LIKKLSEHIGVFYTTTTEEAVGVDIFCYSNILNNEKDAEKIMPNTKMKCKMPTHNKIN